MDARGTLKLIVLVAITPTACLAPRPLFASPVYSCGGEFDLPIPSPDDPEAEFGRGWMEDAVIDVTDHIMISDIDVRINIAHTSVFDLQIFLQNPAGTTLCLNMYHFDEFFDGANYTDTIFDDEAQLQIEQGEVPFTGRFRPRNLDGQSLLEVFDDQDAFGPWRLRIYDMWYADTGSLESFEIMITTPEPATAILLIIGLGKMMLLRPHRS